MLLPVPWDNVLMEPFHHACVINAAVVFKVFMFILACKPWCLGCSHPNRIYVWQGLAAGADHLEWDVFTRPVIYKAYEQIQRA